MVEIAQLELTGRTPRSWRKTADSWLVWRSCTSSIPCWVCEAAALALRCRRLRACRRGPSSKRPANWPRKENCARDHDSLGGNGFEMKSQKDLVREVAQETMKRYNVKLSYLVGTMIELPRAAVTADRIAEEAEFFSFGTNDLTKRHSDSHATTRPSLSITIRA